MADINIMKEPCVNCGSTRFTTLHKGRDLLHNLDGDFCIDQCCQCELISIHPRLSDSELENYYPQDYLSYLEAVEDEKSKIKKIERWYGREKQCRVIIKLVKKPGRILDIGCATGIFLSGMDRYGWDCYGVEPSAHAAQYARNRFNLNIFQGYLDQAKFPEKFFDVITLWDVLEHMTDPMRNLMIISQLLKPSGLLVINIPNAASCERYIFGRYWAGWDIPRHQMIFTPASIRSMLSKNNFLIEKMKGITGGYGGFVLSMNFMLSEKKVSPRINKLIMKILRSNFIRILTLPVYTFEQAINRSSYTTIFARNQQTQND